jgi:hypothetical protein
MENQEIVQSASSLSAKFIRNSLGLLDSINYKFTEEGAVNWRAMVNPKYLYVNKESFQRRKENIPDSIEGLKDADLIIQLPGLRELAYLRGFTSVSYKPIIAGNDYAATSCCINWIGNYETEMIPVSYEALACANSYNTGEFVQTYLIEMSENRSFCRAVRNFLRISIVSREELPPPKRNQFNSSTNASPSVILANLMKEKGRSFKEVQEKLIAEGDSSFQTYTEWSDVPGDKAFHLIDRFKNLKESRGLKTEIKPKVTT